MEITTTKTNDFSRLFDLIEYQLYKYPCAAAFNYCDNGTWTSISINEFKQRVDALSCWFLENQFKRGDKIILIPAIGTPGWMIIDFACQQVGLIPVPLHANLSDDEYAIIIKETRPALCIATSVTLARIKSAVAALDLSTNVYQIKSGEPNFFSPLLLRHSQQEVMEQVISIRKSISENDLATIMYTSGSSGEPKGVMLTHRNIVHNIKSVLTFFPLEANKKVLSFLPFSHILERTVAYAYVAFGVSIYFSESRETFTRDFKEVRPYFCTCVPRVLEKMYDYLQQQLLTQHFLKRKMIEWAIQVAKVYKERERVGFSYGIKLLIARLLVLRNWRSQLGGKIKYMAIGAASLRPDISRLLYAAGIQAVEGYGLTETAPLISINRFEPGMNRFGTVGLVIPGVEVRIDIIEGDEGEILVKGPNVMAGYYLKPALTTSVLTDGWFRTGDIGKWEQSHFLKITDRKKEIFKTSSGKYVAPLPLQNHFSQSPFIQRCLIMGFQKPYVTALVLPNFTLLQAWCEQNDIHWTSPEFMIHNIKILALIRTEIEKLNEPLQNYQRVKDYILCPQEWSIDRGELTATLKPVRTVLEKNYQKEIEKMYMKSA